MNRKPVTDAPARSLADRLALVFLGVGLALTVFAFLWAFLVAPLVKGAMLNGSALIGGVPVQNKLLFSQKIFYFHVPVALASFVALFFVALFGLLYLIKKDAAFDVRSRTMAEVSLVFILATMVSGDLWTRFEWGVWWVWEPRLTTYFILMLLVIGYFVLRNAVDDPHRQALFASVFGIIAFLDAPLSFFITRMIPSSIHPVVFRTDSGLPPNMLIPFLCALFGMLMIAYAFYRLRLQAALMTQELEGLKRTYEQLDERAAKLEARRASRKL